MLLRASPFGAMREGNSHCTAGASQNHLQCFTDADGQAAPRDGGAADGIEGVGGSGWEYRSPAMHASLHRGEGVIVADVGMILAYQSVSF